MTTPTQIEVIQSVLREFGAAIRGDWGDIDGRSIMHGMNDLANDLGRDDPLTIELARYYLELCPTGGGHWCQHCKDECFT